MNKLVVLLSVTVCAGIAVTSITLCQLLVVREMKRFLCIWSELLFTNRLVRLWNMALKSQWIIVV